MQNILFLLTKKKIHYFYIINETFKYTIHISAYKIKLSRFIAQVSDDIQVPTYVNNSKFLTFFFRNNYLLKKLVHTFKNNSNKLNSSLVKTNVNHPNLQKTYRTVQHGIKLEIYMI